MDFTWDDSKAASNIKKHDGVSFTEAITIWLDQNALEVFDTDHSSSDEERFVRMGMSQKTRVLVVVYFEEIENELVRVISARKAEPDEQDQYFARVLK